MSEIVIFYAVIDVRLGDEQLSFTGVGMSVEKAQERALEHMKESEYLKCVHYQVVATHFGIM